MGAFIGNHKHFPQGQVLDEIESTETSGKQVTQDHPYIRAVSTHRVRRVADMMLGRKMRLFSFLENSFFFPSSEAPKEVACILTHYT